MSQFSVFLRDLFNRAPNTGLPLPKLTRILKEGMTGPDVLALQRRLYVIGFSDLLTDSKFGEVTDKAVRAFQLNRNLDPDGEVGDMTWGELGKGDAALVRPPLLPPSIAKYGEAPPWYKEAEKDIGFRETGNNQGLDRLIKEAGYGSNGWQWCKLFVGAKLKEVGYPSLASGMARSIETDPNFIKLDEPALGAIVTMWRGQKVPRGTGHIFFYDGESPLGVRGIGGNESNMVKRSFHSRAHCVGYYWPKAAMDRASPLYFPPKLGKIIVNSAGQTVNTQMT